MSEPENPYAVPQTEPGRPSSQHGGSIEQTLAGNADLDIGAVLSEAWQKTDGIKGIVIGGAVLVYAALFVVTSVLGFVLSIGEENLFGGLLGQLVAVVILYPFMAGVFMVGLRRSVGLPVSFDQQFQYYGALVPIISVGLLQSVATSIGFILLIIPGIYLSIALSLAIPLKVDKGMDTVECLTMSLKLVNQKFVSVLVLALVASLAAGLGFVTIIGWIWTIPWMLMIYAITYRQLAGTDLAS